MNWIRYNDCIDVLKEGTICRIADGTFLMVGEINTSSGTNDEFSVYITHYTNDYCETVAQFLKEAKNDFLLNNNKLND